MSIPAISRRTALAGVATAAVGTFAGCSGDDAAGLVDTPESVCRAYTRQSIQVSSAESMRAFVAETNSLIELVSADAPLRETLEEQIKTIESATEDLQEALLDANRAPSLEAVERLEIETVAEDTNATEIDEQFGEPLIPDSIPGRNLVIDLRLVLAADEVDETRQPTRLLVVPEDGRWRVFATTRAST